MSDEPDIEKMLRQAARLKTLVAISRAKRTLAEGEQVMTKLMSTKPRLFRETPESPATSSGLAQSVQAELLRHLVLKADGSTFGDTAEELEAMEGATPVLVSLGTVTLRVVDANPVALARATGAADDEDGQPPLCMLVECTEDSEAQPCTGQFLVMPTGIAGVALTLRVWISHSDLRGPDALDMGPDAERNPDLDGIGPNQALLVLELPTETE
ncbi:hypothetical protein [Roseateles sp.]|uniref:hypothetical protein n=1 Tax=Roseateles sp. TaxID=1971397 RepID=UPI003263B86A